MDSFRTSIVKEFELKTKQVLERVNKFSNALKIIEQQQESLQQDIKSNTERTTLLESENYSLINTVAELNSRISRLEQHSRANNLEIQNVPEYKSENLDLMVRQIARVTECKLEDTLPNETQYRV